MAYTTITKEIAVKCPELSERIGETISKRELATIQAKYGPVNVVKTPAKPVAKKVAKPKKKRVTKKTK